jgi:4-hydroxy-3-polyprenylbenzoate decarboxylase
MNHRSTRDVVTDLQKHGRLIEVAEPVSPYLEMAEIQRRVYERGGPAILFSNVLGCAFPMAANLFGSLEQARFLFRKTIDRVRRAIELKIDPTALLKNPFRYASAPWTAWSMLPKPTRSGPVLTHSISLRQLPQLVSWPNDGGAFVTLPQVLSMGIETSLMKANLGMYRIQLSGNEYVPDQEIGLHYQLHRGIGVHHQAALAAGKPFRVTVTVGGTPAMTLAAVMPLPEGLSELTFAGALAGHRIPMIVNPSHAPIYADADFMITGTIDPERTKPEGPFGDHLGYYAKVHEFPFMNVERVSHRPGAIWPFTVVGRPPQEDTTFGELIHELTGNIIPTVLPGVRGVHAVDAAGVHPLLLAIGSERYTPYRRPDRPQELLTQANAILGQGQLSLAKYLWIANQMDAPELDVHDIGSFFRHILERIDWSRDLHFQTRTTIDTLDYSGEGFNQGSKVVVAATGAKKRDLHRENSNLPTLPNTITSARLAIPGALVAKAREGLSLRSIAESLDHCFDVSGISSVQLIVLTDDDEFASKSLKNWLWVTFTRSNPAIDIDGVHAFTDFKHWGCRGPLLIDARIKPHHAPPLVEDPEVTAKVDAMAARGGAIAKFL